MPEAPQTVRSLAKLDFTTQAEDILTPFRRKALRLLLKAAVASQTKTKVLSASVDAWSPSEEDAFPSLDLLLSVKGTPEALEEVTRSMSAAIAEHAQSWSEEEREDYRRMIYFSVRPDPRASA